MAQGAPPPPPTKLAFETHPERYVHWKLAVEGSIAWLSMNVQQERSQREGEYALKLNSYDLGVDLELADAIQRIRFEHPGVRCLVVTSAQDKIFCSGANIYMLGSSTHSFKVNFCKYTNETRLALEDLAWESGVSTLAALNGTASGGGYELALACERILLIDDGNSAVSFPEAPLLGVLPGTGGLTRLVDKRKVRRDRADVFSTIAEGIKGRRAVEWNLVDEVVPRSRWSETVRARAAESANTRLARPGPGARLEPIIPEYTDRGIAYRHVKLELDHGGRVAHVTMFGPGRADPKPSTREAVETSWALRFFRELDDLLLRLRFEFPSTGLIVLRSKGDLANVLTSDEGIASTQDFWLSRELRLLMKRVLKRLDLTARSVFALVEPGSCFAGALFETALAADRIYMLQSDDDPVRIALSPLNRGALPMSNGLSRLETRFLGEPARVEKAFEAGQSIETSRAEALGLVTFAPDDIDWEDEVRIAIEERINFSPDAMTGMEANLRFPGPETMETKIFGRLSAWQNWIFQRPNAVGERGALSLYGKQVRPEFDMTRT